MNILQIYVKVYGSPKPSSVVEDIRKTFKGVRNETHVDLKASGHPANTYTLDLSERPVNFIAVLADDSIQVELATSDSVYTHSGKIVVVEMPVTGFTLTNTQSTPTTATIIYG